MTDTADVIVAGLGAMGSAAASALARRGVRVIGLDRFRPPHDLGSSHGESRIIRAAYFEHPLYVPLARAAFARWRELEQRSGRRLLQITGVLVAGAPGNEVVEGAGASATEQGVEVEWLDADEIRRRHPAIAGVEGLVGLHEPGAGVVFPELAIETFLAEAAAAGAELRFDEPMLRFEAGPDSVEVETARSRLSAGRLLIAAGAWVPKLLPTLPLTVERQVLHWFEPSEPSLFAPSSLPVLLVAEPDGALWYGVPDLGQGLKVALHHDGATTDPDAVERTVRPDEVEAVRARLRQRLPAADTPPRRSRVCLYTNTPDRHFLIDELPSAPRVLVASPCSGHGFKFSSALGEMLADRLAGVPPALDLSPFRLERVGHL